MPTDHLNESNRSQNYSKDISSLLRGNSDSGARSTHSILDFLQRYGVPIGIVLILAGIIYKHVEFDLMIKGVGLAHDDFASLLKEAGFAFIISQLVGRFLDLKSHERLQDHTFAMQRQLEQSIYLYLYDVDLPKEFFSVIERDFFQAEFIRRSMKVDYKIYEVLETHLSDGLPKTRRDELMADYLIFDIHLSYYVQNLKKRAIKFPGFFAVERDATSDKNDPKELSIKTGLLGLYVDKTIYSETKLKELENIKDEELTYQFDFTVDPEQSKYVSLTHRFIKRKRDKEIYKVHHICDGIDVTVQYPKSIKLHIEAVSSAQSKRKREADSTKTSTGATTGPTLYKIDDGFAQYIVEEPLFPANGVYMWWEPVRQMSSTITADAARQTNTTVISPPRTE